MRTGMGHSLAQFRAKSLPETTTTSYGDGVHGLRRNLLLPVEIEGEEVDGDVQKDRELTLDVWVLATLTEEVGGGR